MINIKNVFLLPLIFVFFPAFVVNIPGTLFTINILYVIVYALLTYLVIKNSNKFINKILKVIKTTPFKIILLAMSMMVLNSIFLAIIGVTTMKITFTYVFGYIIMKILPIMLYFIYIIDDIISYKKFIKLFLLLFWLDLICGFISYFGQYFDIFFINTIFDFFANKRLLYASLLGKDISLQSNYFAFGLPRLDNLFEEPGHYAQFLFLFLPFLYNLKKYKIKIVKNKIFNKIIINTMLPFTWLSLILTFSPIFLIFAIVLTIILYFKQILKLIKKNFIVLLAIFLVIIGFFQKIDLSETYLSRIINVLINIKSMKDFILIEPSLACRVIGVINTFCIYLQHPLCGVGIGNLPYAAVIQYAHSPVPLTIEIINQTKISIANGLGAYIFGGFITTIMAENGTIITIIWLNFFRKLYKIINKIKKYIKIKYSFYDFIAESITGLLIACFLLFLYNLNYLHPHFLLILIICIMGIYSYKRQEGIYENKQND